MRIRLAAALALALSAAVAVPSDAGPPETGPGGRRCSLFSVTDPTNWAETQVGTLLGGPLTDMGTLICTVQVNYPQHDDPDAVAVNSVGFPAIVDHMIVYENDLTANVYLCTSFVRTDGATVYWHPLDQSTNEPGHWTYDATSDCDIATSASTEGDIDGAVGEVRDGIDDVFVEVGPTSCFVLKTLSNELGLNDPADPVYIRPGDGWVLVAGTWVYWCGLTDDQKSFFRTYQVRWAVG